jgi:D-alanyl-D-alanine carboxypeptidase/D-alanyl-D-alanine-endopeptidase (penicillin-binding protein 4)
MPHVSRLLVATLSVLIIAVSSPVAALSGQSAPHSIAKEGASTDAVARLKREIDAILTRELLPATNAGIKVISLRDGKVIYEFNPQLLLVPASTQKLFTAAAALALLGPDREVATSVGLDAAGGKIYLKGCGDSLLSEADVAALAKAAAPRMSRDREYALVADLSCFDELYRGKGWMWDDDEFLISPLSVNQNGVTVQVEPGSREGAPAVVTAQPRTSYYTIENLVNTGKGSGTVDITAARRPGDRDNVVTVSGVIPSGSAPVVKRSSVWRPELMALTLFRDALRAQGVKAAGLSTSPAPAGATVVARIPRRVEELVRFALKTSDNLTAESLLKLMGLQAKGPPGSGENGGAAVRGFLERQGGGAETVVLADGSGLSRYNLSSAEAMTHTLRAVYQDPNLYGVFRESLPVAGKDGTLKNRMKGSCAEGNLRGKTGNMSGVSALAGYASTADGEPLAFAIMIQNYAGSGRRARDVQDRIGALLCGFRRTR